VRKADTDISPARLDVRQAASDSLLVVLAGDWKTRSGLTDVTAVRDALRHNSAVKRVSFDTTTLREWNSGLIAFLLKCEELCQKQDLAVDRSSLPSGVQRLMELAQAVPAQADVHRAQSAAGFVERVGLAWLRLASATRENVRFLGECTIAIGNVLRGRATFRRRDVLLLLQQCGAEALGIVTLIAFLVGLIMAFVGSVQLTRFGASIYVADMVAIAMVREMGCMMTAVIMCGRTGAAFAAQLGTMKVNRELDAFTTLGIAPVGFLVAPRVVALLLMIPLLTAFANLVGIVGGYLVAMSMLYLSALEYWQETLQALNLTQGCTGVIKSLAFGLIVALTACLRGMQCGSNAEAVGRATTSAVVTGITWIIIADAVFAVVFHALDI
jgi:phospholipid/cholesterol/gamma-HCH transport system permease protein